jgi:hypothetical protein
MRNRTKVEPSEDAGLIKSGELRQYRLAELTGCQ